MWIDVPMWLVDLLHILLEVIPLALVLTLPMGIFTAGRVNAHHILEDQ
jgi:hypothetical protein